MTIPSPVSPAAIAGTWPSSLSPFGRFFDNRPLLPGEDPSAYDSLLDQVSATIVPQDVMEALWLKNAVDLAWEIARLQRIKDDTLLLHRKRALERILRQIVPTDDPSYLRIPELASAWMSGRPKDKRHVERILNENGYSASTIQSQAYLDALSELDALERHITTAEVRRDKLFGEIERHRSGYASRLRETMPRLLPGPADGVARTHRGGDDRLRRTPEDLYGE